MSGLTQADVTPNAVEEEQDDQQDDGYRFGRWLTNPGNELRWLGGQVKKFNDDIEKKLIDFSNNSGVKSANPIAPGFPVIYERDDGTTTTQDPAAAEVVAGVQEAVTDVPLQLISVGQQSFEQGAATLQGREAVQTDTRDFKPLGLPIPIGQVLEDSKDQTADFLGIPRRYELDPNGGRRLIRDVSSAGTSAIITLAGLHSLRLTPGTRPYAFTGMRVNPLVSKFRPTELTKVPGWWGAYWRKNPEWARSAANWLSFAGLESFGTTLISDQTEAGYADPGDSQATATLKSLIPNAGQEIALGSVFLAPGVAVQGANRTAQALLSQPSSIARTRAANAVTSEVKQARKFLDDKNLQTQGPDGTYEFVPNEATPEAPAPTTPREALEQLDEAWDPELPESDTIVRALDRVEPSELPNISAEVAEGRPLAEVVGQRLDADEALPQEIDFGQPTQFDPVVAQAMFMAYDTPTLRAMAEANPAVARMLRSQNLLPSSASRPQIASALDEVQLKGEPIAAPTRVPENAMPPAQIDELKTQIMRTAIDSGQVRPTTTPIPEVPEPPAKPLSEMTELEQLIDENRLEGEWTRIDNAKTEDYMRQLREADGYYEKTNAEQAADGKYDDWDDRTWPSVARNTGYFNEAGQWIDTPQGPMPAPTQQFALPADVAKSKPRFGMAKLTFASDLDRAAYIIRNKAKASKGEARIIKALEEQGYDIAEIRARGDEVKALIQDVIEEQTGSRRAPQSAMELEIPDTESIRDPDAMMSPGGPELPPIDRARLTRTLEDAAAARVDGVEAGLREVATQLFGDDLPAFRFERNPELAPLTRAWGGDGKTGLMEIGGRYYPLRDVVQINNLMNTPLTGQNGLREIMAHESWHRIQAGYLTQKESKILSNVFGKQDLEFFGMPFNNPKGVQPIEIQALAFQRFYTMKQQGLTRMDLLRDGIVEALNQTFPRSGGRSWRGKLTTEALTVLAEGWERIIAFYNRSMNYIEGNGFRNVYDVFEDAYQGRLTAERKLESFTQVLAEANRIPEMDEVEFNQWLKKNPDFSGKYERAAIRKDYWDSWKGRSNQAIAKFDSDIAVLKQQANQGGC